MQDPFENINNACNAGTNAEKYQNVPDFPDLIDIELSGGLCNLKCPMCPVGRDELTRDRGFMSHDTFATIIKEIRDIKTPVRLVRFGEPMMNPSFWSFIRVLESYDIPVHLDTNGTYFDDEDAAAANLYKIGSIKISIHEDSSMVMRSVKRLELLTDTHTQVSITTDESGIDIYNSAKVDKKTRLKTFWLGKEYPRPSCCSEVFNKLSINWDGTVSACCADYDNLMLVGDIRTDSLKDIWNGPAMNGYREIIAQNRHWTLPLCRNCYDLSLDN